MLRLTKLYASTAATSAAYYADYLAAAPGEGPGVWAGEEAASLGLSGPVDVEGLELLLSGRDPVTGTRLGGEFRDASLAGFDATFSAPKSVSAWWALTGDRRLLEVHDVAVTATLEHLERFGSTTRIRSNGGRLHPDTGGLIVAAFRQTTSRADDPQLHTHAVISAKVRTPDDRWLALDARYLLRHQRMLSDLYQSVLRAELSHRLGVAWEPVVKGKAEIAGVPAELREMYSKRHAHIERVVAGQVAEFRQRHGRGPSEVEVSVMTRKVATETRCPKSGHGVAHLRTRWRDEAAEVGWTAEQLTASIETAARDADQRIVDGLTVQEMVEEVSAKRSSWCRPDVIRVLCQRMQPATPVEGRRWAQAIERAADKVLDSCVDLDPPDATTRRASDDRSVWIEPTAYRYSTDAVLAQEEHILTWAMDAQLEPPSPSTTIDESGLDVLQQAAASAVAGGNRLAVVIGPAGAGKTRMLAAAGVDLARHRRHVFGVAPTAKAARVLERDAVIPATTVAKLLYEWTRPELPQRPYRLPAGTTLVVDEAGMISTPDLGHLVSLAERQRWRLVLVGDHAQLQAVGRGGLFAEVCANSRVEQLEQLHRFTHEWEAEASLQLRAGNPDVLDVYERHGRVHAGGLDSHLEAMATAWLDHHQRREKLALVASTNDHVDDINQRVQVVRGAAAHLYGDRPARIAGGEVAWVGEVVATRRNDRQLVTTTGEQVRNRNSWTVTTIHPDGALTVTRQHGGGSVTLPADYVQRHVRLGYAATEHGYQSETADTSICLASPITTRRGLYVAATRGRNRNDLRVITDTADVTEARAVLEGVLASDRADIPAVTQRRTLAAQDRRRVPPARPRCQIPGWFEPLLAKARADLAGIERREHDAQAARARLVTELAEAEHTLKRTDAETDPDRYLLDLAKERADRARQAHTNAVHDLSAAPRRQRRAAREAVAIAERRSTAADRELQRIKSTTGAGVERFHEAVEHKNQARFKHDSFDRAQRTVSKWRDADIDATARRVQALETWQQWASGAEIAPSRLQSVATALTNLPWGVHTTHERALGRTLDQWLTSSPPSPPQTVANPPLAPTQRLEL